MSETFYEIARWRLDEQLSEIGKLNDRLVTIFTVATAILALIGTLQNFDAPLMTSTLTLYISGLCLHVLIVLVVVIGLRYRRPALGPELSGFDDPSKSESEHRDWAAGQIRRAIAANERILQRQVFVVSLATWLWGLEVMLFSVAVLLELF